MAPPANLVPMAQNQLPFNSPFMMRSPEWSHKLQEVKVSSDYRNTAFTQISPQTMINLGREDTALILLARSLDLPSETLKESIRILLQDIQRNHHFGSINRAFGPLNAEENPPRSEIFNVTGDWWDFTWLRTNFPLLALRNDAMLEEAFKFSRLSEVQLERVVETAKRIKMIREGGDNEGGNEVH
jgi:hypothetical protein